jgi:hypothetical protein
MCSSERFVTTYKTTGRHYPEDISQPKNLKYHIPACRTHSVHLQTDYAVGLCNMEHLADK